MNEQLYTMLGRLVYANLTHNIRVGERLTNIYMIKLVFGVNREKARQIYALIQQEARDG